MRTSANPLRTVLTALAVFAAAALAAPRAFAHCDTLEGPVVADARIALEKADVTPVLKWVRPEGEAEVRAAFAETLEVRKAGREARALADRYFFETLVRVHRAGEGEPFEGLKPAGTDVGPAIHGSDQALAKGSVEDLVKLVAEKSAAGLRERFERAAAKRKLAGESVEAGREFVAAYVEFMHYAERLYDDAAGAEPAPHAPAGHTH